MLSRNSSIKAQMALFLIAIVTLLSVIYGVVALTSLTSFSSEQVKLNESRLEQTVISRMKVAGEYQASRVTALINESFALAIGLAKILADTAYPGQPLSREDVTRLTASTLEGSRTISAMYAQFEPNGYDNDDGNWTTFGSHSTPSGSLEVYFVKENGVAVLYPVESEQEKYAANKDDNGIREAEWYLCSRDTKNNCALDPYLYEIDEGNEELMTTLSAPVVVSGQFRGLVGVDINLPVVQQWVEQYATSLFDGKADIELISQRGLLIASSQFEKQLTQPVSDVSQSLQSALGSNQELLKSKGVWMVKVPVTIEQADTTWTLIISIPEQVALQNVTEMKNSASDSLQSTTTTFLVFAVLSAGIAVAAAFWLTNSITAPIRVVSDSISELADKEGDLTQVVDIRKHAELINLANGFNRFITKLADMIRVSKHSVQELASQQKQLHTISNEVEGDTQRQQAELDNVVTAVTQMAAAASEVAKVAADTAAGSSRASELVNETQTALRESVQNVEALARGIDVSSQQVSQVAHRSADISGIVGTIQSIAEQTNLLALNAAIEAARAGEQGRGFAVVADEVRNLAARTQSSTQEIATLIDNLQSDVNSTVSSLEKIHQSVSDTVGKTTESLDRLNETLASVEEISEGATQVASAAEEQSTVSEDINMRLTLVSDSSRHLAKLGNELQAQSINSKNLVDQVEQQLSRLKV
ncbi:methyl-accepting chemotaxis protein [Aestuariibacter salexigens]|uniref:methyl-accepting chemotaxis protein n=1 Tax=Aestuariibacter salexigens TaxID=226010 RepID=UPI0003F4ED15|nr:methyl-accepting chemotaxis protein [Aestuariibacter salexigens]